MQFTTITLLLSTSILTSALPNAALHAAHTAALGAIPDSVLNEPLITPAPTLEPRDPAAMIEIMARAKSTGFNSAQFSSNVNQIASAINSTQNKTNAAAPAAGLAGAGSKAGGAVAAVAFAAVMLL